MILFETPRLRVRHLRPADANALFEIFGDPIVTCWVGDGTPLTFAQCQEWISISLQNYHTKGFGASAVELKATGAVAGVCGIVYGPGGSEPEIIYAFGQPYWGHGLASEVVPAMLAYGVERCGLARIMATIAPENLASRRIAQKAGMRLVREELSAEGLPSMVYYYQSSAT